MSHVIDQGWAMYWGTSRWSSVEISEAYNNCRQFNCPLPICEQSEYHFLYRDKIEISLPEVYNKLGNHQLFLTIYSFVVTDIDFFNRRWVDDLVAFDDGLQRPKR